MFLYWLLWLLLAAVMLHCMDYWSALVLLFFWCSFIKNWKKKTPEESTVVAGRQQAPLEPHEAAKSWAAVEDIRKVLWIKSWTDFFSLQKFLILQCLVFFVIMIIISLQFFSSCIDLLAPFICWLLVITLLKLAVAVPLFHCIPERV